MVLKLDCATLHLSLCWINTVIINKTLCQCGSGLSVGRWLRALGRYLPKGAFQPLFGILKFTGEPQKAPVAYGPVNIDWYFNYPSHNLIINHKHSSFTFPCRCSSGASGWLRHMSMKDGMFLSSWRSSLTTQRKHSVPSVLRAYVINEAPGEQWTVHSAPF